MKRLLLLGGGHAHVAVLASLAQRPIAGLCTQLVTPFPQALYSGMIPGWVEGLYALPDCAIDLRRLAAAAGAELCPGRAAGIDPDAHRVTLDDGTALGYDLLSIDIGSLPAIGTAQGVAAHAITVRPLEGFVEGWERVRGEALAGRLRSLAVVGGGAAGVELALAMAYRLQGELPRSPPPVRLLTDAAGVLPGYPTPVRRALQRRMDAAGIAVHGQGAVQEVGPGYVRLVDGNTFDNDATFWAAGAAAHAWLRGSGLQVDERGFIAVNAFQQSASHPDVFAAGDCATRIPDRMPKSGVFAVRAGPALAANLRAQIAGAGLQPHQPRRLHLSLLAAGGRTAVGAWGPLSFSGRWVWRWKDRIDRAFIARYAALPAA